MQPAPASNGYADRGYGGGGGSSSYGGGGGGGGYGASNGYSAPSGSAYGTGGGGSSSYSQPAPRAAGHASFHATSAASDLGDPYRVEKGIQVTGRDVPAPTTSFERANFTREILEEVRPASRTGTASDPALCGHQQHCHAQVNARVLFVCTLIRIIAFAVASLAASVLICSCRSCCQQGAVQVSSK